LQLVVREMGVWAQEGCRIGDRARGLILPEGRKIEKMWVDLSLERISLLKKSGGSWVNQHL